MDQEFMMFASSAAFACIIVVVVIILIVYNSNAGDSDTSNPYKKINTDPNNADCFKLKGVPSPYSGQNKEIAKNLMVTVNPGLRNVINYQDDEHLYNGVRTICNF